MESKLQALKVVDLKKLLQDANLPVSGAKADLVKRLLENPEATASLGGEEEEEDLLAEASEPAPVAAQPAASASIPITSAATTQKPSVAKPATATEGATESVSEAAPQKDNATLLADTLAELEKRKARALRWGMPTEEIEAKINKVKQNGLTADTTVASVTALDGELKTKGRKEAREEKRAQHKAEKGGNRNGQGLPETEEQKAARLERQQKDAEAKQKRAEKYASATAKPAAPVTLDPVEEEKKRKRMERFGTSATASAEPAEKKAKV